MYFSVCNNKFTMFEATYMIIYFNWSFSSDKLGLLVWHIKRKDLSSRLKISRLRSWVDYPHMDSSHHTLSAQTQIDFSADPSAR